MKKRKIPEFYRQLYVLCLPIAIQNLISAAVSSADVVMLNYVSQTAIAAASLASKVMFVLFMFTTGITSGVAMLVAQYWGKGDTKTIEKIFGIALRFSLPVSAAVAFFTGFFPSQVMRIFTDDPVLIAEGAKYLQILSLGYLAMGFSQLYLCTMRSIERVKFSTITGTSTVIINITLNACFIWGLFGLPKLGLVGVAAATLVSRIVELIICVIDALRKQKVRLGINRIFEKNPLLLKDFLKYSLPAIGNECSWGMAYTVYSIIMGHLGEDLVAANAVVSVIRDLCATVGFGIAYGGAIILGKTIGEGRPEDARKDASRLMHAALFFSIIGGLILLAIRPLIFGMVSLTPTATSYLSTMMYIGCYYLGGQVMNTAVICGVFRAGGDSKFGFILDTIEMWLIMIPLGFLCAFVFKLSPMWVYFVLCLDEFIKMPVVYMHYKRGKWLQNITRDFDS